MSTLNKVTDRAVCSFKSDSNYKFDPAIIMIIAELVMGIVEALQEYCADNSNEATDIVNSPTRMQRRRVRRMVRRELGWREFKEVGADIVESLLKTGATVTPEEMEDLYNEV